MPDMKVPLIGMCSFVVFELVFVSSSLMLSDHVTVLFGSSSSVRPKRTLQNNASTVVSKDAAK